mmetsp:Transcript_1096/g.977  ORF Transcript_1096/g.977 Transcript_1096/m.977 type:complete len:115 (-) Transcript_1096:521-865(-)
MDFKKGPFHLAKEIKADIVPVAIVGANRLFKPGQIVPTPGNIVIRYLEKIPKDVVETTSLEDLQAMVRTKLQEGLETVPDHVIYDSHKRPMGYSIFMLGLMYAFWATVGKLVLN